MFYNIAVEVKNYVQNDRNSFKGYSLPDLQRRR